MHIRLSALFLLCFSCLLPGGSGFVSAQEAEESTAWQAFFEMLAAENEEDAEEDLEQIYEALSEIAAARINLNAVTREDLQAMMCFSENQTEAVLDYVSHYGPLRTKSELMMIPFLDTARRGLLASLTYLGEMPPRRLETQDSLMNALAARQYRRSYERLASKGEAVSFARIPFYNRKGDSGAYKGGNIKHWLRAGYSVNSHVKIGLVAAQDAGEPFFQGKDNYGYDFYSGYLQLKRLGIVKNAVVGRYRIKTGLGLVLNNNFSFGKLFSLSSIQSTTASLRQHSSRTESNYMQGAAFTLVPLEGVELTAFASYKTVDATLTKDSAAIATLLRTGYHRTASELARRHNAKQGSLGANIHWNFGRLHLGATALANHYSLPLRPYEKGSANTLYKKFHAAGQNFWNASIDYGYKAGRRFRMEGETATGDCGKVATINTVTWTPDSKLSIMGIQRFYPYKFHATMGSSFSEGGANQNESGLYAGVEWNPSGSFSLAAYSDVAVFPWPKYQALGSSHSFDNLVQITFLCSAHSSLTMRYRVKCREKDGEKKGQLIYKDEHRLRVSYSHKMLHWTWKSQADLSYCKYKEKNYGGMLSATGTYSIKTLKTGAGASYFNTTAYDARVYAYEQGMPYTLSFPSFYGEGCRLYAVTEYAPSKSLAVNAKIGFTHYFNRDKIGSSYQQINSSSQTDLEIMLRWKFK